MSVAYYWHRITRGLPVIYSMGWVEYRTRITGIYGIGIGRWFFGAVRSDGKSQMVIPPGVEPSREVSNG